MWTPTRTLSSLFFGVAAIALILVACVSEDADQPRTELLLPIPAVLKPTRTDATTDYYTITNKVGYQQVLPTGPMTRIEGFEGSFPGPTIRARRGREVVVNQVNDLDHPVVPHNHGHKVTAASDGHPVDYIRPGASREYHYPNDQLAATFWIHDHTMGASSRNVWDGQAMFYVIEDDVWDRLHLPSGEYDVPLLIADRAFQGDNAIEYPFPDRVPVPIGNTMTVNGARTPRFEVAARKYLFRLLNSSDVRIFELYFQKADAALGRDIHFETFKVVSSDGGLLARPVEIDHLEIGTAERYGIVFDFSRFPVGTSILLRNRLVPPPPFVPLPEVMRFDIVKNANDDSVVPDDLQAIPRIDPSQSVATNVLEFSRSDGVGHNGAQWFINGRQFDPARVDFHSKLNTVETWNISNTSPTPHTFHLHLVQFQVLDINGAPPRPEQAGWKDTVLVRPFTTTRIVVRWEGFPGVYVFHCHILEHEDNAMMGQVEVRE